MSDEEIAAEVLKYPAEWIILTGGEPSLWIDSQFVCFLKDSTGKKVAIETNGSNRVPYEIDWITVSPKVGMEGAGEYEMRVDYADELKVVDVGQDLEQYFTYPCVNRRTAMYLQPCFVADRESCLRNRLRTVERVMADPRWTLSVQLHRFLGIR